MVELAFMIVGKSPDRCMMEVPVIKSVDIALKGMRNESKDCQAVNGAFHSNPCNCP